MNVATTSTHSILLRLLVAVASAAILTAGASAQSMVSPLLTTAGTGNDRATPLLAPVDTVGSEPASGPASGEPAAGDPGPGDTDTGNGHDTGSGGAGSIDTSSRGTSNVTASDRAPGTDDAPVDLHPRITQDEYMDAGHPRYTMTGQLPYRDTYIQTGTLTAFGGALLGLAGVITLYQQAWYPDSTKGPFNFQVDWSYAKEFDKVGHAFGGWMSSYCSHEAFIASGLSKDDAAFWGTMGGLFFQTMIEVQDGFHTNYGFDWTDELGNVVGAGYFYAQRKIPFLQNFDPKWSVGPTGRDSAREAAQIRSRLIVDDYDRQDMWLSVKVHNLLPEDLKPFWPKWLQLAVGAGARDVELIGYRPYRVLHLSLDYNLVELLPDLGPFGNWLVQGLNAFHLPAPALQLWPTVKFELLYPFHL